MNKHPIRFGIQTGQQQVTWNTLRELWEKGDQWGYDSLWNFDHFYPIMGAEPAGPCMEAWTLLTALSQHTRRARVGTMVNGNTYRNPCITAKMAATLDQVSAGRFMLGIGAGWYELEHKSFGVDFKTIGGRLRALDEACQIIKGMFTEDKTTLHGRHYSVLDAVCNPKPVQKPHPPILIAGTGEKVLLKIVAKHADMWNALGTPERMAHLIEIIKRHGDNVGRNSDDIEKTILIQLCFSQSPQRQAQVLNSAAAMARTTPDKAREQIMIGGAQECLDKIDRYARAGVTHFIFTVMQPYAEDELQAFAEQVIPHARPL